jgi:hypothetical protein
MYRVFQFRLSDAARDHLNSVGWDGDFGKFPEIKIQRDVSFMGGSEKFEPWMEEFYTEVALIEGAETMEDVFAIGNGYGDAGTCITKYKPMHSMSVGDIVIGPYGNAYMCDSVGWTNIEGFKEAA